jgi:hypothetical protein
VASTEERHAELGGRDLAPIPLFERTVAHWDNGQIVEENLMYDLVTFMKQLGLMG